MRQTNEDWKGYEPDKIPTKRHAPLLMRFVDGLVGGEPAGKPIQLLDLGCGNGTISGQMAALGCTVTGIDINPAAIQLAEAANLPGCRFLVGDIAAKEGLRVAGAPFDAVVGQLVLSVIGLLPARQQMLANVRRLLRPGGHLFCSASGVSDQINPAYQTRYARDSATIGEPNSYFSRDVDGQVLYQTHHFKVAELNQLFSEAGFVAIEIETVREASSRRPGEAAFFHYITCQAPLS